MRGREISTCPIFPHARLECVVSEQLLRNMTAHMAATERRDHPAPTNIKSAYMGIARFVGNPVDRRKYKTSD